MNKTINKLLIVFFTGFIMVKCGNETKLTNKEILNENNTVTHFLVDVKSLESDTNINPIVTFKNLADEIANDKVVFTKENIKEVLINSRDYTSCVIVTANHTIVKIESLDDCQQSGSWKACMPKCSGYIKKSELNFKNDYLNNIIGVPDNQERVAYYFNSIQTLQASIDSLKMNTEIAEYPYIHAISKTQSSLGWELCEDFYCNNFYLTNHLYEYHPVFKDQKDQYLFLR